MERRFFYGDAVFLHRDAGAEFAQLLRHRFAAVAFLQLQPRRIEEDRASPLRRRCHQDRREVGTVGKGDLLSLTDPFCEGGKDPVPLQGVRGDAGHAHVPVQQGERLEKGGVRRVPLDGRVDRGIGLSSGDAEARGAVEGDRYAEIGEDLFCDVKIGEALRLTCEDQLAVPVEQGKGEEQPCRKLAADAAGDLVAPRRQPAAHGQGIRRFFKAESPLAAERFVDRERSLEKPFRARKGERNAGQKTERDQKAQRAAALPDKEGGGAPRDPAAGNGERAVPGGESGGAERADAAERGGNVCALSGVPDPALSPRQRRADQIAVRVAFRGGSGDGAGETGREDRYRHPSRSRKRSIASQYPSVPCPMITARQ